MSEGCVVGGGLLLQMQFPIYGSLGWSLASQEFGQHIPWSLRSLLNAPEMLVRGTRCSGGSSFEMISTSPSTEGDLSLKHDSRLEGCSGSLHEPCSPALAFTPVFAPGIEEKPTLLHSSGTFATPCPGEAGKGHMATL